MPNARALVIAAGAYSVAYLAAAATQTEEYPKRAPYDAVRWEGEDPIVRIGSEWFCLVSIDGFAVGEIVDYSRATFREKWRKRFEEDLVEVLSGMGHEPGEKVRLVVRDPETSQERTLQEVAMTLENRQKIWFSANSEKMISHLHAHPYSKRAPYAALRWEGDQPEVRIDDEWLALDSIEEVAVGEIVAFCHETYGERWRKRFEEDLVEAMTKMGHEPGETVRLVVRDPATTETRTLEGVAMTRANRQAIWRAAQARKRDERSREEQGGESGDEPAE